MSRRLASAHAATGARHILILGHASVYLSLSSRSLHPGGKFRFTAKDPRSRRIAANSAGNSIVAARWKRFYIGLSQRDF